MRSTVPARKKETPRLPPPASEHSSTNKYFVAFTCNISRHYLHTAADKALYITSKTSNEPLEKSVVDTEPRTRCLSILPPENKRFQCRGKPSPRPSQALGRPVEDKPSKHAKESLKKKKRVISKKKKKKRVNSKKKKKNTDQGNDATTYFHSLK